MRNVSSVPEQTVSAVPEQTVSAVPEQNDPEITAPVCPADADGRGDDEFKSSPTGSDRIDGEIGADTKEGGCMAEEPTEVVDSEGESRELQTEEEVKETESEIIDEEEAEVVGDAGVGEQVGTMS